MLIYICKNFSEVIFMGINMNVFSGQVSLVSASAILFMDSEDTQNKGFANYKYKDNYVPMIDVAYFVDKLDKSVSALLETKVYTNDLLSVSSTIIFNLPLPSNHGGLNFDSLNSLFCKNDINKESNARLRIAGYKSGNDYVQKIVDAEIARNGDYILNNLDTFKMHDGCAQKLIKCREEIAEEEGTEEKGHADDVLLNNWYQKDDAFALNYYRNVGIGLVYPISQANWGAVRDDALKALYIEYIVKRKFDKVISFEDFYDCVLTSLKETEANMQCVQRQQKENHD